MKASKTELLALFKQAFEGCGFDHSACESAAELVVWSQMHGQPAFAVIAAQLASLSALRRPVIEIAVDLDHEIEMDVGGASTILCAEVVSDLVAARASLFGHCAAMISNCHQRQLMVRQLILNRARGMHGLAYWRDGHDHSLMHTARVLPDRCCPELISLRVADSDFPVGKIMPVQTLALFYCSTATALQRHVSDYCPWLGGEILASRSPAAISACYQQAISMGVEISDELWQSLLLLASAVLVESSAESRRGAG